MPEAMKNSRVSLFKALVPFGMASHCSYCCKVPWQYWKNQPLLVLSLGDLALFAAVPLQFFLSFPGRQVRLADVSRCFQAAVVLACPFKSLPAAVPSPRQGSGCNGVHLQGDEATHRCRPGQTVRLRTTSSFLHRTLTMFTSFYACLSSPILYYSTIPVPLNSWFEFLIPWASQPGYSQAIHLKYLEFIFCFQLC